MIALLGSATIVVVSRLRVNELKYEYDKAYEDPEKMGEVDLSVLCSFAYISCKKVPIIFSVSVCPSTGNYSKSAQYIFIKFIITSICNTECGRET